MKLSVSTGCAAPLPLALSLPRFAEAGFQGVELVLDPRSMLGAAQAVRRQVQRSGLRLFSVHPPFIKAGRWRNEGVVAPQQVELAAELGAALTLVHPPGTADWEDQETLHYLRGLDAAQERGQQLGVRLAMETAGRRWHGDHRRLLLHPAELKAWTEQRGLGLVLDVAHVGTLDPTLEAARPLLAADLAGVHLSDVSRPHEEWRRGLWGRFGSTHQMPGEGMLPLTTFLGDLAASGFAGYMTLEVSPLHLAVWDARAMVRRLRQAVEFVRCAWRASATAREEVSGCSVGS
ncbi:MAG: sugar phosphate isomerase/epimerase [Chloroflexi bacterium]|nr:sugar phosphate isomerase/epimerase [Chloroflexota bacterium]